jgi:hypothetical protein
MNVKINSFRIVTSSASIFMLEDLSTLMDSSSS